MNWDDCSTAAHVVSTYFGIDLMEGSEISPLVGYSDKNFSLIEAKTKNKYALKIVNPGESDPKLTTIVDQILQNIYEITSKRKEQQEFIVPEYVRTLDNKLSTSIEFKIEQGDGHSELKRCNVKLCEFLPGVTIMNFVNNYSEHYEAENLYSKLGRLCCHLSQVMQNQNHLRDQLKIVRKDFPWQLLTCDDKIEKSIKKFYPDEKAERRILVNSVLSEYRQIKETLTSLPEFILHGDLSGKNILVDLQLRGPIGLIDFQDIQVGPKIVEVAILLLYSILEQEIIEFKDAIHKIPSWLLAGYQAAEKESRLSDEELKLVPILVKLRLCQSLMNGLHAQENDPKNEYTMNTNKRGWDLLGLLSKDPVFI